MNDINTAGDGMTINGDLERQTLNSGSSDAQTQPEPRGQSANGAASVCTTCDGTGWTHHATKGLTQCKGLGFPHGQQQQRVQHTTLETTTQTTPTQ